ncbi:hypothetical protein ACFFLS_12535 [Flavobacterium procerum]|uniref:Uncharacterized protein n=1 Tax=Flavobacterium procerum TaxID=1455569 RepID=A0ABV6BQZ8_9FLAO
MAPKTGILNCNPGQDNELRNSVYDARRSVSVGAPARLSCSLRVTKAVFSMLLSDLPNYPQKHPIQHLAMFW